MQDQPHAALSPPRDGAARSLPIPGLVWAFRIHSDGIPEMLAVDQPIPFSHDGLLWLHFNLADARALQWLTPANLGVPIPARTLLLSKDTYQQLHTVDDCVYGVISDLLRDVGEATEDTGYLRFIMTEQILISGRHQALCAVEKIDAGSRNCLVVQCGQRDLDGNWYAFLIVVLGHDRSLLNRHMVMDRDFFCLQAMRIGLPRRSAGA